MDKKQVLGKTETRKTCHRNNNRKQYPSSPLQYCFNSRKQGITDENM